MSRRSYNKNYSPGRQPATEETSNSNYSNFAPRRANKLKEFFGLNSIQKNLLPRVRSGGTSRLSRYIRFNRNIRLVGSLSAIMLMVIGVGVVVPYYIKSAETEAAGESHFGDALLTFSSESLAASVTLSNLAADGSFATSTSAQQAKFSISTTNYTGYTLAIQAAEDTVLSGTKGGSLTAIPQSVTTAQYTANNISNVNLNNTWGFLPNYYKSGSNIVANTDTYLSISTTASTILDETTSANTEAKQYTISLGARADYTNTVDTFSNTFILQYIANPVNYAVTYDKNAGTDTVTNMPYENNTPQYVQAGHVEATSITLSNLIPLRNNYTFLGWCSEATGAQVDNSDTCAGTIYNDQAEGATPNLTFNLIQTEANETTLYAMWHQELKTNINQLATMQDFASLNAQEYVAVLGSMTVGTSYELADSRDDETYNVAKLEDGNVWLLDNLRLDPATLKTTLTTSNTNMSPSVSFSLPASSTADFADATTNYENPHINTESKNNPQSYGNGSNKIGVYYNYCAASAGTYCMPRNSGSGNASYDICPAGWRMPTGGSSGEYRSLANNLVSVSSGSLTGYAYVAFKEAFHASLSGNFFGGFTRGQGSNGYFWSSTYYSGTSMYILRLDTSLVNPENSEGRYVGNSVRCVLRDPRTINDIEYMQDMNSSIADTMTVGAQYQLTDSRDGKTYYIAKLQDGHVWMTQNLDLDLKGKDADDNDIILTSENTDLTAYGSGAYTTVQGYSKDSATNVITWTPANATIDASAVTNNSIPNWTSDYNIPYSVDPGNWYWNRDSYYTSDNCIYLNNCTTKFRKDTPYTYNGEHGHVGNYYNWSAAIATNNSITYSSSTLSDISNNPQNSICPAGWRLPTIYNSASDTDARNEFYVLLSKYDAYVTSGSSRDQKLTADPLYFVRGGNVSGSRLYYSGNVGHYWSSTVDNDANAYYLGFTSSSIYSAGGSIRPYGYSVRCLLR